MLLRLSRPLIVALALAPLLGVTGCNASRQMASESAATTERPMQRAGAPPEALAAGYRERLRLGLGSPFRLIESALLDPRLSERERRVVARELLDRTRRGEAYEIDPTALLPTLSPATSDALALATGQMELVERAVGETTDPRTGELAVRLGYRLALMEGIIDTATFSAAVESASLVKDRWLARIDARRILTAADRQRRDPLELVPVWRREHRLLVETPALRFVPGAEEREAIDLAPHLLASLRALARRPAPFTELPSGVGPSEEERMLLRRVADATSLPPRAPIVLAVRWPGFGLREVARGVHWSAWRSFTTEAIGEESFAGGIADLVSREPSLRTVAAKAAVRAAVGMRPFAQESPWFPGMVRPTAEEIRGRYGVRVQVDSGVPADWRPYFLDSIDQAIQDLRSIAPAMTLQGLTIQLTMEASRPDALALHRPTSRTLEWPVTTGPGTFAHEIAHDLDRQAALRANGKAAGYASKRAAARGGSPFASALARLAPGGTTAPDGVDGGDQPAELLARSFEWFVVTRLAAQGRWNGTLASAQDEVITGRTGVSAPAAGEEYGSAVIAALRPLVLLPSEEKRGFLSAYGPGRQPGAYLFLNSATAAAARPPDPADAAAPYRRLRAIEVARDRAVAKFDAWLCGPTAPFVEPATATAYLQLIGDAAAAQARAGAPAGGEAPDTLARFVETRPAVAMSAFSVRPADAFCRAMAHASPGGVLHL
jgi:hypothetical protein